MDFLMCKKKRVTLDLNREELSMLIAGKSRMGKTYFMSLYGADLIKRNTVVHLIDLGDKWSENDKKRIGIQESINVATGIKLYFPSQESLQGCARYLVTTLGYSSGKMVEVVKTIMKYLSKEKPCGFSLADLKEGLKKQDSVLEAQKLYDRFDCILELPEIFFCVNDSVAKTFAEKSIIWDLAGCEDWTSCMVSQLIIYDLFEVKKVQFRNKYEGKKVFIFVDEFQNLECQQRSIIGKCLTEGQKYGIYMVLATQFLQGKFSDAVTNQIKQGGFQIYFRMTEEEAGKVARELEYLADKQIVLKDLLSKLPVGQFLLKGPHKIEGCNEVTERLRLVSVQEAKIKSSICAHFDGVLSRQSNRPILCNRNMNIEKKPNSKSN